MEISDKSFGDFLDHLSEMLGEKCEIVVMDVTRGYESSVVKVINGISGRAVGDMPSNRFFENLPQGDKPVKDWDIYYNRLPDGRVLKTLGMFLRDGRGEITGGVNLSMDVTALVDISGALARFIGGSGEAGEGEVFTHTLDELMDHYLGQAEVRAGKPASQMSKAEKLAALRFLDGKGVLHMAKSGVRLCQFFGFSKYTLYAYLDEIRGRGAKDGDSREPQG